MTGRRIPSALLLASVIASAALVGIPPREPARADTAPAPRDARVLVRATGNPADRVTAPADGLAPADLFVDAGGSVALDSQQTGAAQRTTVKLPRPATGWQPGSATASVWNDPFSGACTAITEFDLVEAAEVDGVPTALVGSFRQACAGGTVSWGHVVYPADRAVAVLDVSPTAIPVHHNGVTPATAIVTARNVGELDLDVGTVTWAAGGATPTGWSISGDGCSTHTLAGGESCVVEVTFDPTVAAVQSVRLEFPNDGLNTPGVVPTATLTPTQLPSHAGEVFPVTRANVFVGAVAPGVPTFVDVAGQGGVPEQGAAGAWLDVSVRGQTAVGSVSVVAGGAGVSDTVGVSFGAKKATNNMVLTRLGADGTIRLDATVAVTVSVAVVAWIADATVRDEGWRVRSAEYGTRTEKYLTDKVKVGTTAVLHTRLSPEGQTLMVAEVSSPSADAELHIWSPDDAESAAAVVLVEKGQKRAATVLVRTDHYGAYVLRMTKGTATVRLHPLIVFATGSDGDGTISLFPMPTTVVDTSTTTPLAARSSRVITTAAKHTWLLGSVWAWASGATGAVGTAFGEAAGPRRPVLAQLYSRRGQGVSGFGVDMAGLNALWAVNDSSRPTHLRFDAVARIVDGPGIHTAGPARRPASTVPSGPSSGPSSAPSPTPVTASAAVGDASVSISTLDLRVPGLYTLPPGPLTEDTTATLHVAGAEVSLVNGTTTLLRFRAGPHDPVAAGHYLGNFDGTDIEACGQGRRPARLDLDIVDYEDDALVRLVGRATVSCVGVWFGQRTIQFAFPADAPQPRLQVGQRTLDFDHASIFAGATQPLTLQNTGTAPLVLGTLSIRPGGDRPALFTIAADPCSGTSVPPGGSCTVDVRFQPDELYLRPPGQYEFERDWVLVPSNATAEGRLTILAAVGLATLGDLGLVHFAPTIVLDSGDGTGLPAAAPVAPGSPALLDVAGAVGLTSASVTGAIVEISVWGSTAPGTVTLTADGTAPGTGVSLAFAAGEQLTHAALAPVSLGGLARVHTSTAVNVRVRLVAYLGSDLDPSTGLGYTSDPYSDGPERVLATSKGLGAPRRKLAAGIAVATSAVVPANAPIVVSVPAPATSLSLRVWRTGQPASTATTLLFTKGLARSSTVFLPGPAGPITVEASASTHLNVDTDGIFAPTEARTWKGRILVFDRPQRDVDSRAYGSAGLLRSRRGHVWSYTSFEDAGVGLDGLLGTVTSTGTTYAGTLMVFSAATYYRPTGVSSTTRRRADVSNFVSVGAKARAAIVVYSANGTTHYVWDISGFVTGDERGWYPNWSGAADRSFVPLGDHGLHGDDASASRVLARAPLCVGSFGDPAFAELSWSIAAVSGRCRRS